MAGLMKVTLGVVTLIGAAFTAYFTLDARHAAASDLQLVEARLENKIVGDQIYQVEQRIWRLRQALEAEPGNNWLRDELQRLQGDLKRLEREQGTIAQ